VNDNKVTIFNNDNIDGYIIDEQYLKKDERTFSKNTEIIKLSADEYYVLGDNRNLSKDSRSIGPIKEGFIRGRVMKTQVVR
jgi:signal peptidase I